MSPKIRMGVRLGLVTVVLLGGPCQLRIAKASRQPAQKPDREITKIPVARLSRAEPTDPEQRALRIARNRRFNRLHLKRFDELRQDTKEVTGISHFWQGIPGLPSGQSDAVVIARILSSDAYASEDKTAVYTEYEVEIDGILKNDALRPFGVGEKAIADREGGGVELSDGRVLIYRLLDQGRPEIDGKYVLFMKYNQEGRDYSILTGYRLEQGRVRALDDSIDKFSIYDDVEESRFLRTVREAVENPPRTPEEIRRPSGENNQ